MKKKIELIMYRYKAPVKFYHSTIKDAVEDAIGQLNEDLAFPHQISKKGKVIWKMTDYLKARKELLELRS